MLVHHSLTQYAPAKIDPNTGNVSVVHPSGDWASYGYAGNNFVKFDNVEDARKYRQHSVDSIRELAIVITMCKLR
jgi:hypothetical protein